MTGNGALSMAKRSYPMSEVRGRSWEDPMPEGRRPIGVTPVRGQGQWRRVPGCDGAGTAKRSYPASEAKGGGREEQPHVQGVVAVRAQEGLEEPSHVEGDPLSIDLICIPLMMGLPWWLRG